MVIGATPSACLRIFANVHAWFMEVICFVVSDVESGLWMMVKNGECGNQFLSGKASVGYFWSDKFVPALLVPLAA